MQAANHNLHVSCLWCIHCRRVAAVPCCHREGTTTRTEGATQCEVVVTGGASRLDETLGSADVAILLSFGLLLDGTSLESVSRCGFGEVVLGRWCWDSDPSGPLLYPCRRAARVNMRRQ